MAYLEDLGARFDRSLDDIWAYFASDQHGAAHANSLRNVRGRRLPGAASLISAERRYKGHWTRFLTRSTVVAPLCIVNEELEGLLEGTRFAMVYSPRGSQTQVDLYADVRSKKLPAAELELTFLELVEVAYREDVTALRPR